MRINDKNRDMLVLVCPDMPANLHDTLLGKIDLVFPGEIKDLDTEAEGDNHSFIACHYTYWNHYATRVYFFFDIISLYSNFWIGRQFSC